MKNIATVYSAFAALLLAAGSLAAAEHPDIAQALKDNEAQWNRDYAAKNVAKIVAHYAADAVLMAPGMPSSSGTAAIRKVIQGMVGDPAITLKFQATHVEVSKGGDLAFTQGTYNMTMTNPANPKQTVQDHGSYVTVYRKEMDGSWKAVSDIATSEVPPTAGK